MTDGVGNSSFIFTSKLKKIRHDLQNWCLEPKKSYCIDWKAVNTKLVVAGNFQDIIDGYSYISTSNELMLEANLAYTY